MDDERVMDRIDGLLRPLPGHVARLAAGACALSAAGVLALAGVAAYLGLYLGAQAIAETGRAPEVSLGTFFGFVVGTVVVVFAGAAAFELLLPDDDPDEDHGDPRLLFLKVLFVVPYLVFASARLVRDAACLLRTPYDLPLALQLLRRARSGTLYDAEGDAPAHRATLVALQRAGLIERAGGPVSRWRLTVEGSQLFGGS